MRKITPLIFLTLALTGMAATAGQTTAPDPLEQILDKLNAMEKRLDTLEGQAPQAQQPSTPKTQPAKSKTQPPATTPPKDELTGGMVIKIKNADTSKKGWLTDGINDEHFAGFVFKGSAITTKEIQEKSIGYKDGYAIEIEGFLNAKEKGLYNLGIMHEKLISNAYNTSCVSYISLNGTELGRMEKVVSKYGQDSKTLLVSGSVSLEPGLYEYTAYSACDDYETQRNRSTEIRRTLLIKTPDGLSMRGITPEDILHKK